MKRRFLIVLVLFAVGLATVPVPGVGAQQETGDNPEVSAPAKLTLIEAAMCEGIRDYAPLNAAIAFPVSIGQISCFSSFDPVPGEIFISHSWFYRDKLVTKIKLFLKPPRWATFSSIHLREADIGPWRVEINDDQGRLMKVLRFSITE
jgi:hypothetical protein